ncbi:MAG TPA: hypothetical protein VLC06_24120 [Polyangia bacterium]|jgi:hypothetical protein|nr:hypothetical protein [Polyangia bacterium]
MDTKPRLTKQGIKDLNHYGPKPTRAVTEAPLLAGDPVSGQAGDEASVQSIKASLPTVDQKPDAPVSAEA